MTTEELRVVMALLGAEYDCELFDFANQRAYSISVCGHRLAIRDFTYIPMQGHHLPPISQDMQDRLNAYAARKLGLIKKGDITWSELMTNESSVG
jgi:hypothetical protein